MHDWVPPVQDIAVVTVETPFVYSDSVRPICIPEMFPMNHFIYETFLIAGFGNPGMLLSYVIVRLPLLYTMYADEVNWGSET